jgi:GSCFA family.
MVFTTEVGISEFSSKIDYSTGVMFVGSCFSDNIGQKLNALKFPVDINPFGVLYNPVSIANSLELLKNQTIFDESDLFHDKGLWNSFSHHSSFSDVDLDVTLTRINSQIQTSGQFLKDADFLMLTFGTAWVYQIKGTDQVVSNCHKVAASHFTKRRLNVAEIVGAYMTLLDDLWKFNPKLKIVFTVSPIRHWKDGAVENQVSKSTLILAINELVNTFNGRACAYFPAYELVMDELRDYRYYAADMIHLSDVAVDYVFERFRNVLISKETLKVSARIEKLRKAMSHRPFKTNSTEYRRFVELNIQEIHDLQIAFPNFNFKDELTFFEHVKH